MTEFLKFVKYPTLFVTAIYPPPEFSSLAMILIGLTFISFDVVSESEKS